MSKVLPFNIPKPDSTALIYQEDKAKRFYDKLHQHEEYQLSIIIEGAGDLIVGDKVGRYSANDVFLIGSNVPHLFKSDSQSKPGSQMLTLFFRRDSFGQEFFDLKDLSPLRKMLDPSFGGLKVETKNAEILRLFSKLSKMNKLGRFVVFIQIMELISKARKEYLTYDYTPKRMSEDQGARMSTVMSLAMNEFHRDLSLSEVSSAANMSVNAFCRFFKQKTNKTFVQLLNEIRLEHSCNLLVNKRDMSIADISTQSGFNNLSNFNRQFRAYKKTTPRNYRLNY